MAETLSGTQRPMIVQDSVAGDYTVIAKNGAGNAVLIAGNFATDGASKPASAAGFAVGCLAINTNATTDTALWTNEGTTASCTFVVIPSP